MPQEKKDVHWTQVVAALRQVGSRGMAVVDLAKKFDVPIDNVDFLHALDIVEKQRGDVLLKYSIGKSGRYGLGNVVTLVPVKKLLRRDELKEQELPPDER